MSIDETIKFSQRMEQLPPYLFGMINKMKMEKRRNGDDVIDLGMGNPIGPAPEAVTQKLCEVARDPKSHRYPVADGLDHLRREIALNYQKATMITVFFRPSRLPASSPCATAMPKLLSRLNAIVNGGTSCARASKKWAGPSTSPKPACCLWSEKRPV